MRRSPGRPGKAAISKRARILTLDAVILIAWVVGNWVILGEWDRIKHLLGNMTYPSTAHLG